MSDMEMIKAAREIEQALGESVMIGHSEIFRLVVKDLVFKRNACRTDSLKEAFDTVLKNYYLSPEEFIAATKTQKPHPIKDRGRR